MLFILAAFVLGTAVGSFLNAAALRWLAGESAVRPPSRCPACGRKLAPKDLVPVLSYVLLRGRCRYCKVRISPQHPLVEAATGLVFAALAWRHGLSWEALRLAVFFSVLIAASVTDARETAVPVGWVWLVAAAVATLKLASRALGPQDLAAAAACWAAFFLASRTGAFGDGDAPVAALVGVALGPAGAAEALFWAFVSGGAWGAVLIAKDSRNRKRRAPLVPFLAAGSAAAALWPGLLARLVGM